VGRYFLDLQPFYFGRRSLKYKKIIPFTGRCQFKITDFNVRNYGFDKNLPKGAENALFGFHVALCVSL
jgi:hypothetical protein